MKKPVKRSLAGSSIVPGKNVSSDVSVNKEPVGISLRLSSELAKKLETYCTMTGVSKNGVISLAVSDFLADRE